MEADRHFGEVAVPNLPLVRFFTWERPAISYGCNQNPYTRLDLDLCRADGIQTVRRPTGGRELLHGRDLCYCITIPTRSIVGGVEAKRVFDRINDVLVGALRKLGIDAEWNRFERQPRIAVGPCFAQTDLGEIVVGGRKLVASAQRVYPGAIVQEGSIPLVMPEIDLVKYLRIGERVSISRMIKEMTAFLTDFLENSTQPAVIVQAFREAFEEKLGGCAGSADSMYASFYWEYSNLRKVF